MLKESVRPAFIRDDSGAGTAWWVLWMIVFIIFGGVSVDSANAWRMRAELQATADAAALAGVIDLPSGTAVASASAISYAQLNMDTASHGNVVLAADVEFGEWAGGAFNTGGVADSIRVRARRDDTNSNRLKTYFLRLIGMDSWNVTAEAIAQRYFPECLNNNVIIAAEIVDFQSINTFNPGICIHANDHVEVNNGNTWLPGVNVTMPSLEDFVVPNSDMETQNPGLADSLGEEWFYPKIIDSIPAFLASYLDTADPMDSWPDYIGKNLDGSDIMVGEDPVALTASEMIKTIDYKDWDITTYEPGYIYNVTCTQPRNLLSLNASVEHPLENVVIISECKIAVGNDGVVKNAVLGSTAAIDSNINLKDSIIDIGQGTFLGVDDGCSPGGEVQILSSAGISGPADTKYFGVQLLAQGDIHIAAQASGIEGINVQAGGDIDWASQNTFGPFCAVVVDALQVPYFRLVY